MQWHGMAGKIRAEARTNTLLGGKWKVDAKNKELSSYEGQRREVLTWTVSSSKGQRLRQ